MEVIEKIQNFIDNLDDKKFYIYLASVLGGIFLISSLIIWHYYHNVGELEDRFATINEQRVETQRLLSLYEQVKKHRTEVDALIAQDPNFKIGDFFNQVIQQLGLSNTRTVKEDYSRITRENKYEETILKQKLSGLNMKQLTELLHELDNNKRIYIKDLDITTSKQARKSIDVTLTIATIEPKLVPTA